jgi:purine-binding chemotaxis protein CheW
MAEKFEPDFAWQETAPDNGAPSPKIADQQAQPIAAETVASTVVASTHGGVKLGFLIFNVEDRTLALDIKSVEQVCQAVEITPLPSSPASIVGLVNVHGSIVVVLNVRKKLGTVLREIELSDQLVIAYADERQFALLVDDVKEVASVSPDQISIASNGQTKLLQLPNDKIPIPIYDLANVLSEQTKPFIWHFWSRESAKPSPFQTDQLLV